MTFDIRAITLDLDDTLWPFAPIGERIERKLHAWLETHSPATARQFPIEVMRELRTQVTADNPHLIHDLSALRKLTLEHALRHSGADLALLDPAFEIFYAERNRVECYPDAVDALTRIAARVPVAALTNGNADLARCGLDQHFVFQLGAREHGAAKPEASIFHAACVRLALPPEQVLHVGDHAVMDAAGAMRAGLRAAWLNREGAPWPLHEPRPDLEFSTLTALADWLDAHLDDKDSAAA
ncbi:HAD family hydrolase [Pseudoxanthomonas winnipegensis]|uniref:HAD family hydrolase n=1 Tax=Pseudoxanthomonas winnipegensis TaxID=2480810 RepID=A0A4Q8LKR2_9GAMM|nr:HAD-IA family hydrolase [Pseudoxanthomonas winnipegensis]RZZ85036.1 HAD family hydrolase [Pseudoxanthomonas winnipegensis]TAA31094.1 HAD family hydrolase [Pseudoxanthomonas winnipegensis]TAA38595.1 HAD family hydrolase [Pseudoxanthomonas winnipegensis]TBV77629.1 HAD family hydrolase [Pseudoxanthomonas winnipegensis]